MTLVAGTGHLSNPEKGDVHKNIRFSKRILATFTDSGREVARYIHGPGIDEPLAELRKHRTRFYHADTLGSIIALTENHGHPIREYRYSAFGIPEDHRGDPQPYRFTGREWDEEVDLYYYRARYYGPRLGRFLTEDPIGLLGGLNIYRYVLNNPLAYTDPLGFEALISRYPGAFGYGHVGIGVNTPQTRGHYPPEHSIAVVLGKNVPGTVKPDTRRPVDTIRIQTTPEQDRAMQKFIDEAIGDRIYNLTSKNCASFVEEVLRAGGLQVPPTMFPRQLMRELHMIYGEQRGIILEGFSDLPAFAP